MAIKKNINQNIEEVMNNLGYEYADFVKFMEVKDNYSSPKINDCIEYTVVDILNKFIQSVNKKLQLKIKSQDTQKYYISFLLRFSKYINENHKDLLFENLNENIFYNFVQYTNDINGKELAHSSFNTYISILKKICTFAAENDYARKNFNYKFTKLPYEKLPRYLSEEQVLGLFKEINLHKDAYLWRPLFITMLWTGLRIHELSALKINYFDIENKLIFTIGKNNKERYIPLYPVVEEAVLNYLKSTGVNDYRIATGYLFSRDFDTRETPVSIRNIQSNFKKFSTKINLENHLTVHSLRHTFAVNSLKVGMEISYLMQVLGHAHSSSTDIYTKLLPKDLQEVIQEKYPIPLEKIIDQLLK